MITIRTYRCTDADCPPERRWLARLERDLPVPAGKPPQVSGTVVFAATAEDVAVKARAGVEAEEAMLRQRQAGREKAQAATAARRAERAGAAQ